MSSAVTGAFSSTRKSPLCCLSATVLELELLELELDDDDFDDDFLPMFFFGFVVVVAGVCT